MSTAPDAVTTNATETSYTMWEKRLGVHIARANHDIHAAGASLDGAAALDLPLGSPVLVLERISYTADNQPL